MGNLSDRSNPKYFLSLGLFITAGIAFVFGFIPWSAMPITISVVLMWILMFLNGWFQGMGWPACGRTMVHWWSTKERGTLVSIWNVAHNVGAGLSGIIVIWAFGFFNEWQAMLYIPAGIVVGVGIIVLVLLKDTPQSVGLPPIEEFKDDYPKDYTKESENELSSREIFITYIFKNKMLWYIAVANVFVYFIRYGILDWSPTYLTQIKHFSDSGSGWDTSYMNLQESLEQFFVDIFQINFLMVDELKLG